MRVVVDTNVLLSGLFFGGTPGKVLKAWREAAITLVVSTEILEEYRVAGERLAEKYSRVNPVPFLSLVAQEAVLVNPEPLEEQVCSDPDDDKFLACALASQACWVVSGDKALLDVGRYRSVRVVTPRRFIEIVAETDQGAK